MNSCPICSADESREQLIEEVFRTNGKYVLVKDIPAKVCVRCGEETFSARTEEAIRVIVNGDAKPHASVSIDVFTFTSDTITDL